MNLCIEGHVETESEHSFDSLGERGRFRERKSGSKRGRLEEHVGQIFGRRLLFVLLHAMVQFFDQGMPVKEKRKKYQMPFT